MSAQRPVRPSSHATIARSTLTVLAGSGVGLLGALATRILIARTLAPAEVGVLLLAMAISSAAAGVATLGLGQAVGRRVAELRAAGEGNRARGSGLSGLTIGLASGLVFALVTVVTAHLIGRAFGTLDLGAAIILLAPLVIALPIGGAAVGVGRAWGDAAGRAALREAAGGLFRVTGVAVGAVLFVDLHFAAAGFALGALLGELSYAAFVWNKGWFSSGGASRWDAELVRRLPPFWLMVVVGQLETWLSVLILGLFAPPAVVGLYGMARGLTRAVKLVEYAASHSFLPTATTLLEQRNHAAFLRLFVRARTLIFALQWPALAVCIFAPETVMRIVFGPAYGGAATTLCLLSTAAAVTSLVSAGKDHTLIAIGKARDAVAVDSVSVGVTVVALLWLTPNHGSNGAALSVLVGSVVQAAALTWLVVFRSRTVPLRRDIQAVPLMALVLCGLAAILSISAGLSPFTNLVTVAVCGCIGSAACMMALWKDHNDPGSIFPAGPAIGEGELGAPLSRRPSGLDDLPPTLFEP